MAELCLNEISHTQKDVLSILIYISGVYNRTTEAERKVPEAGGGGEEAPHRIGARWDFCLWFLFSQISCKA